MLTHYSVVSGRADGCGASPRVCVAPGPAAALAPAPGHEPRVRPELGGARLFRAEAHPHQPPSGQDQGGQQELNSL